LSDSEISLLREEFEQFLGEAGEIFSNGTVADLSAPVLYSLSAPGKRLRPVLCMMFGGYQNKTQSRGLLFAAAALECIHTYSLIHDDLPAMDNDDLRRGIPTCHKKFSEWAAILAGDALNTFAFELLAEAYEPVLLPEAVKTLARKGGRVGMIAGQALDLKNERGSSSQESPSNANLQDTLQNIHLRKTAALIQASCVLGSLYAKTETESASGFGETLGLLFQVSDDLLDARGSNDAGKATLKDAKAGKLTYPFLYGMEESMRICADLETRALSYLARAPISETRRHALAELTRSLKDRTR